MQITDIDHVNGIITNWVYLKNNTVHGMLNYFFEGNYMYSLSVMAE